MPARAAPPQWSSLPIGSEVRAEGGSFGASNWSGLLTASCGKQGLVEGVRPFTNEEITMTYRIRGIDPAPYRPLFGLSDGELAARGIVRMTVSEKPSFPCRVTLEDRDIG